MPTQRKTSKAWGDFSPDPRQAPRLANIVCICALEISSSPPTECIRNPCITPSTGNKLNVFSDSGRKQDLSGKIAECLPVRVEENDELPKSICELCVQQLHQISEYRQKCSNTDTMFRSCLGSPKLKNEGRVYVKDEAAKAGPGGSKPATNIVTLKNMKQTLVPLVSQQHQQQIHVQQQVQQHIQHQQLDANTMTISAGNDYLSNIVQSVGIKVSPL